MKALAFSRVCIIIHDMNDNHSQEEYLSRWVEPILSQAIREEPVVVVTGARQVGKSTLLRHVLGKNRWRTLTLDNMDVLAQAEKDPEALLAEPGPLVIDEVQKCPSLLPAIKMAVDVDRKKRRFVLSGSANLLLLKNVSETLAGRATYLKLEPFTWGELQGHPPKSLLNHLLKEGKAPHQNTGKNPDREDLWKGFFPVIALEKKGDAAVRWWEGYVTSYLERDLRQLSQIDSLVDFRRLMSAIALRNGQLLNQTELGRDVGIPQPTIHRYLNLLEASQLFFRLPAYAVNRTKRLIKSPKFYLADSGLTSFLTGHFETPETKNPFWGALFETFVFQQLRSWCELQTPKAQLFYWHTQSEVEVDFVIEQGKRLLAIEAKATATPRFAQAEGLREFMKEYPETQAGIVVHWGTKSEQLDKNIYAIPLAQLV